MHLPSHKCIKLATGYNQYKKQRILYIYTVYALNAKGINGTMVIRCVGHTPSLLMLIILNLNNITK